MMRPIQTDLSNDSQAVMVEAENLSERSSISAAIYTAPESGLLALNQACAAVQNSQRCAFMET